MPYSHALLADRGVLVRPDLLAQFGQQVGDRILINGQPFTIRGVIAKEPGRRAGAFSLGSRVMVDYDELKKTGLLSFGSRNTEQILLKVADAGSDAVARDLRRGLRDQFVNVRSYRATEDQIGEDLERALIRDIITDVRAAREGEGAAVQVSDGKRGTSELPRL